MLSRTAGPATMRDEALSHLVTPSSFPHFTDLKLAIHALSFMQRQIKVRHDAAADVARRGALFVYDKLAAAVLGRAGAAVLAIVADAPDRDALAARVGERCPVAGVFRRVEVERIRARDARDVLIG